MVLKEIISKYITTLSSIYEKGEAEAITKIAIEHFAEIDNSKIILEANKEIESVTLNKLNAVLEKLLTHEPIQYIIGNTWFYNLNFIINKHVLIPRPETEELVFEAIKIIQKNNLKNAIDIGTGSGCIPIALKKNIDALNITAIDVSKDALEVAKQNAALNNVIINFKETNFLNEEEHQQFEKFNLIISNPPYIPDNEVLHKNVVAFEPSIALFVPEKDVLIFYKKILSFAENHLKKNGYIMLEVHENLAKETAQIFIDKNYVVTIKKDMQEKERMLIIHYQ
jgi:release factor glutamine methyltransferase